VELKFDLEEGKEKKRKEKERKGEVRWN